MRLIDGDKLRKDVIDLPALYNGFSDTYDKAYILDLVDEQPTIEAEPVRHGRWVKPNPKGIVTYDEHAYAECSVCHTAEYLGYGMAYCPSCGAKMNKEVNENETY